MRIEPIGTRSRPPSPYAKMVLRSRMEQAKSIFPRLLRQHQRSFDELDLVRAYWPEAVGPALAERSRPMRLQPPKLVVEVLDPPWIELLRPMRGQILALLREELPSSKIRRIDFRVPAQRRKGEGSPKP